MHGKMHNDAGETFTDESMIEYEEPPMIPKRLRPISGEPVLGADMEVELIRMKNEPYKRRRSRKAYEKSEFCHGQAPIRCVECKAMLPDADHLQIHMRGHVTEKILAMKTFDPSLATAAGMIHLQSRLYPGSVKLSMENKLQDASESEFGSIHATADNRLQPRNSRESNDGSSENSVVEAKHSIGNEELSKNAKQSDTFTNSNCISHQKIKEEPTETESNSANNGTPETETKVQNGKLSPPQNDDIPVDSSIAVNSSKCDSDVVENNAASEEPETDCEDSKSTTKYCKQCNITFMYLSTFIAHKKYYCSSHAGERANAISTGADGAPELLGAPSTSVG